MNPVFIGIRLGVIWKKIFIRRPPKVWKIDELYESRDLSSEKKYYKNHRFSSSMRYTRSQLSRCSNSLLAISSSNIGARVSSLNQQIAELELELSQSPDPTTYQNTIAFYVSQIARALIHNYQTSTIQ